MMALAADFFTLDEVNRHKIIQDIVDRRLTTLMAAKRLGIFDRQCRHLLSRSCESEHQKIHANIASSKPTVSDAITTQRPY